MLAHGGFKIYPLYDQNFFKITDLATEIESHLYDEYNNLVRLGREKPSYEALVGISRGDVDFYGYPEHRNLCHEDLKKVTHKDLDQYFAWDEKFHFSKRNGVTEYPSEEESEKS